MRISEMLTAIAAWLESPNNEALLLAEGQDDKCMSIVAASCVEAASLLKTAAEQVDSLEAPEESNLTPESIENLATLATVFDNSGNPELKKQASVLDELLLTFCAPKNVLAEKQAAEDMRMEALRKAYQEPKKVLEDNNKIADSQKILEKSKLMEDPKINEMSLNTRYCPEHAGVSLFRSEGGWTCELDKKTFNYETGFTMSDGTKVPGGEVSNQTKGLNLPTNNVFDTRYERLQTNKP